MLIATFRARLTGVSWVYLDDQLTAFLRFVSSKAIQLCKGPTVQLAFVLNSLLVLTTSHLRSFANVGEVLKDDGSALWSSLNDSLAEDMVTVPVKTSLLLRHLFEMSFSRLASFGLKLSTDAETAAINFFPVLVTKKVTLLGLSSSFSLLEQICYVCFV
jgi:hypothetical protein